MTRARQPSGKYPTIVTDGALVYARGGVTEPLERPTDLVEVARKLAGVECIAWVHPDAHERWGLPDRPGAHVASFGALRVAGEKTGWLVDDAAPKVHVAFPAYGAGFADASTALELGQAVERWRRDVGLAYAFSGAKTLTQLITTLGAVPPLLEEPAPDGYASSAWVSGTANTWQGVDDDGFAILEAAGRRWVRVFDRAGSYLSAWRGTALGVGPWEHLEHGCVAEPCPESYRPAGYWRVDVDVLPSGNGLFDPFRRHGDAGGPAWLTTPLLQLAVELAEEPVPVREGWVSIEKCRALDGAGERLAHARQALLADPSPAAAVALVELKRGYSAATNWLEHTLQPPNMLARPSWARSIRERFVANTYRSLAKASPGPIALCEVDAAVFTVAEPDEIPAGLRVDGALGSWKPKGDAVAIGLAREAYRFGGPAAVVAVAEHRDVPMRPKASR